MTQQLIYMNVFNLYHGQQLTNELINYITQYLIMLTEDTKHLTGLYQPILRIITEQH